MSIWILILVSYLRFKFFGFVSFCYNVIFCLSRLCKLDLIRFIVNLCILVCVSSSKLLINLFKFMVCLSMVFSVFL